MSKTLKKLKPDDIDLQLMKKIEHERNEINQKYMPDTNDVTLVILKGHLLAEDILNKIISHKCIDEEIFYGANISFSNKISIAHALYADVLCDKAISMLKHLNSLRNEVAHTLDGLKLDKKLNRLIETLYGNDKESINYLMSIDDEGHKANLLISHIFGYFSCLEVIIKTGTIPPRK